MSFWQKFFNPHHLRLMDRGGLYAKWHNWPHHHFAHYSIFLVYLALIVKIFLVFGVTYHIIRPEPVKAVAWNIIVSGAGDATYNGIYSENGVYNGEPAYTNGDKWLYWVYGPDPELQFGWWFLSSFKGGGETWYRSEVVSPGVLPGNPWIVHSGIAPAPTVTADTWSVCGADQASFNGLYVENGTYNGELAYTNGTNWLYYNGAPPGNWSLGTGLGSGGVYMGTLLSIYLPENPWSGGVTPPTLYIGDTGPCVVPTPPDAPTIQAPEAIANDTIRWKFTDNASDEDGFKVYDSGDNLMATCATPNLDHCDETGLSTNTQYSGRYVVAYNDAGDSAHSGNAAAIYTLANAPSSASVTDRTLSTIAWAWSKNSNPAGTEFYASDATGNSGWVADAESWTNALASANTQYTVSIKARNGDNVETSAIALSAYTDIEAPTGLISTAITKNAVTLDVQGTFSNLNLGSSGIRYCNETTGACSAWITNTDTYKFTGLAVNTTYNFSVESRNGDAISGGTANLAVKTSASPAPTPTPTPTPISGCTDSSATNYNSDATVDDGSCEYAPIVEDYQYLKLIVSPESVFISPKGKIQFNARVYNDTTEITDNCAIRWSVLKTDAGSIQKASGQFTAANSVGLWPEVIKATAVCGNDTIFGLADVNIITEARRLNYVYLAPNSRNYYKNIDSGTANFRIWGWDQYFTPFTARDLDYQSALLDSRIGSINSSNASWILPVEISDNYGCYPDKIKGTAVYKNVAKSGYASINIFSSFESTQKTSFFDWFASYVKAAVTGERTPVAISTGARTTFRPGESHKFVAVMVDQYGQVMEDTQFVFSLNDPQVGSLMPNGQFIASNREGTYQNVMTVKGIWNGIEKTSSYTLKISSATRKATTIKYVGPKDLGATKILKIAPNEPYSVEAYLYDQFGDRIVSENGVRLTKILSNASLEVSERNIIANSGTDFYQNAVKLSFEWADWADPDKHVDGPSPELIFSVEVNEKYANDPKSCLGGGDDGKGTEGTDEDKNVIDIVKDIWNALKRTIGRFLDALTVNPIIGAAVGLLASVPVLVGAVSSFWPNLTSVLLATGAASTRTGFRFPVYATIGRKKGYVYDVLNKMPIAGVLIRVFDLGSDRLIYQTATNQQGEFIIKLPEGRFYIEVKKEGYKNVKFVSHMRDQKAKLNLTDGYYNNIYFPEQVIEVGKQQKLSAENMSIPMQKIDSLKGVSAIKKVLIKIWGFLRILSVPLLFLGTILVIYSLVRDPNLVLNYFIAGYYLLLWLWQLILLSIFVKGPGQVVDGLGKPLDLVLVRAIDEKGRLVNTTVSNKEGKFILNLSKGKYSLTFRKPGFVQKVIKITVKSLVDLKKLKIKLQEKKE